MKTTDLLIPTQKEAPNDAQIISHQLMIRAGLISKLASGLYSYLPMGLRVVQKVEKIIREDPAWWLWSHRRWKRELPPGREQDSVLDV